MKVKRVVVRAGITAALAAIALGPGAGAVNVADDPDAGGQHHTNTILAGDPDEGGQLHTRFARADGTTEGIVVDPDLFPEPPPIIGPPPK